MAWSCSAATGVRRHFMSTGFGRRRPDNLYDVMTNGFGAMPDYAAQIPVRDRWAIAAYMRALQLSQNATVAEIPPDARGQLK